MNNILNYLYTITLYRDTLNKEAVIKLVNDLILFKVSSYVNEDVRGRLSRDTFFSMLADALNNSEGFTFRAKNLSPLCRVVISQKELTGLIEIKGSIHTDDPMIFSTHENIINSFTSENKTLFSFMRTWEELNWNEETDVELQTKVHPEIPELRTVGRKPDFRADVTQFPAHMIWYEGLTFGCCYEMWFGKDYDNFVPTSKLRSFKDCKTNEVFENGTVHIILYESPDTFSSEVSVQRAWAFRKQTDCDAVAECWKNRIREIKNERGLFSGEIINGATPHGGVCTIKSYLDDNNRPVNKCKAVKVHISEVDAGGKEIFGKTIKLGE